VLEDAVARVRWLHNRFGEGTTILWAENCWDLRSFTRRVPNPAVVILDHDLGLKDCDGQLAAKQLNVARPTPVLVWSHNPYGGPAMVDILARRGYRASWAPWGTLLSDVILSEILAPQTAAYG
jgi:hypothetical protein